MVQLHSHGVIWKHEKGKQVLGQHFLLRGVLHNYYALILNTWSSQHLTIGRILRSRETTRWICNGVTVRNHAVIKR